MDRAEPTGSFDYLLATVQWVSAFQLPSTDALEEFSRAVCKLLKGSGRGCTAASSAPINDSQMAHEKLWQIARDVELGYRQACRVKATDDEWTGFDARQIVLNEFLIANSRHFTSNLREATQAYSRSVATLAKRMRDAPGSSAAKHWADTTVFVPEVLEAANRVADEWRVYEEANGNFEREFERSVRGRRSSFFQSLFR